MTGTSRKVVFVAVLGCLAVLIWFVFWSSLRAAEAERRLDPSCYETHPDVDVRRTLLPVVQGPNTSRSGLYACGLYSRPAMPDAIRCYELNRGCSK